MTDTPIVTTGYMQMAGPAARFSITMDYNSTGRHIDQLSPRERKKLNVSMKTRPYVKNPPRHRRG